MSECATLEIFGETFTSLTEIIAQRKEKYNSLLSKKSEICFELIFE